MPTDILVAAGIAVVVVAGIWIRRLMSRSELIDSFTRRWHQEWCSEKGRAHYYCEDWNGNKEPALREPPPGDDTEGFPLWR